MSKKGITIIEIIVVITILMILAIIAIYNSNKTYDMAKLTAYNQEFVSLYGALTNVKNQYNYGLIELTSGEHYYSSYTKSGDTWYTVYGMNEISESEDPDFIEVNEKIIKSLGLSDLKLSYDYKIRDSKTGKDVLEIKLSHDDFIEIKGYRVRTYNDMQNLKESGAI